MLLIQSPYVDVTAGTKYANSFPALQRVFAYVFFLCIFLDKFGLLVDGCLKNSTLDLDSRNRIILPRSHTLTLPTIVDFHEGNLHTGPRALLVIIRSQYCPIMGGKR